MTHLLGGKVSKAPVREYGKTEINVDKNSKLFHNISENIVCWMSHTDYIESPAPGFTTIAKSDSCPYAAIEDTQRNLYGVQFHPEVAHTQEGTQILRNFLFQICNCSADWKMSSFAQETVAALKEKIGDKKVLCALSGGVDSSVAAVMISKAIGKQLTCIFVDHGLLRKNEGDEVEEIFTKQFDVNFVRVNAQQRFYDKLAGVTEPEEKEKLSEKSLSVYLKKKQKDW